jgi:hypothetical protein
MIDDKKRSAAAEDAKGIGRVGPQPKRIKSDQVDENTFVDEYEGYKLSKDSTIDRVQLSDMTPEKFYRDYVSKRKPCVLVGQLEDSNLNVTKKWTSSTYLKKKAGDVEVSVEKRTASTEKFGSGNEMKISFGQFLDAIDGGGDSYYLTTQDVKTDRGGRPSLMSDFMKRLSDDFPTNPKLTGNLIPQNINVWMGCSKDGSSSGLHHDFHDNLYIIVEGRKRIDLYAPSDAPNLYTRGKLRRIHKNGRINYAGEETNADGSHIEAEEALDASLRQDEAVKELELAEAAVDRGDDGAKERLEKAEEALDKAMEAVMDIEGNDRSDYSDDFDEADGEEEEDDEDFWEAAENRKQELHSEVKGLLEGGKAHGKVESASKEAPSNIDTGVVFDSELGEDDYLEGRVVDKTVKDPLNFSLVDTALDEKSMQEMFPRFERAIKATIEISSEKQEIAYIPASWFHEVTSFGGKNEKMGRHTALNYWFHPQDGTSFDSPYSSSFWAKDWALREI